MRLQLTGDHPLPSGHRHTNRHSKGMRAILQTNFEGKRREGREMGFELCVRTDFTGDAQGKTTSGVESWLWTLLYAPLATGSATCGSIGTQSIHTRTGMQCTDVLAVADSLCSEQHTTHRSMGDLYELQAAHAIL